MREGQILSFLDLLNNQVLLLEDLMSLKLSLRGLLTLLEEGDVLLQPSGRVIGSAPHIVIPSIFNRLMFSYHLDNRAEGVLLRFA